MNAIKNGLLDPRIEDEPVLTLQPMVKPPNPLDDDLMDIEVRPGHKKPKPAPVKPIIQMDPVQTTKKPITAVTPITEERYKVVCYYTPWSWYR